ncbi:unnamed protein product [Brugia timori]|uniref:Uncharacterized protein n=1 Tax=Brugia timori TaxID=42155 RepID=A0A0R3QE71_9BILA|nr:unnamed protein product [Brugia timori]
MFKSANKIQKLAHVCMEPPAETSCSQQLSSINSNNNANRSVRIFICNSC